MSDPDRCTCRPGRDTDGSEFGPCEYCERQAWAREVLSKAFAEIAVDAIEQLEREP